jgi:hypothetical protein
MHQQVFANQRAMTPADLATYARTLQLDVVRFESYLEKVAQAAKVRSAMTRVSRPESGGHRLSFWASLSQTAAS